MPHASPSHDSAKPRTVEQKSGFAGAILKHKVWATVGTVVGVVALIVAYVQVQPDDKPAALELANVSFDNPTPIEAKAGGSDMDEADWEQTTAPATPIDISLKNNGGAPAHIVRIETKVLDAKTISCSRQGGGAMVSAYYGVTIPYDPFMETLTNDEISTPVDYTVKAGAVDRMVITIGPEDTGNGRPIGFAVALRLIQEQGDPIDVGPLAVSQPEGVEQELRGDEMMDYATNEPQCMNEQAAALEHIFAVTNAQSPEMVRLRDTFKPVT